MTEAPPLLVGYLQDVQARQRIAALDAQLLSVASPSKLLTTEFPRPARLFLLQADRSTLEAIEQVIRSSHLERPLTDILVWAPGANGATVRTLLHAGAKDVILSRSLSRVVDAVESILSDQQILPRLNQLTQKRSRGARFESMLSRSDAMWDLFDLCMRVARSNATVRICGETGTGKELLARAIHRQSGRQGRFVAANCASISPELINSELFGHEQGAFTGASRAKKGLVMHADKGTLFLDEIGDMPPEGQLSLLRLLQEKQIRPVGALSELKVDVRVVAATNVDLQEAVRAGHFREDLYYRLDVIRMKIPPLRERPEDILFLFGHFTKQLSKHYGLHPPTWADDFLDALVSHDWPGNVRQLENFSERLVLSRPRRALRARDFARLRSAGRLETQSPEAEPEKARTSPEPVTLSQPLNRYLESLTRKAEYDYLHKLLSENRGKISESAERAGISRRTLLRKMKQHQLNKNDYKP